MHLEVILDSSSNEDEMGLVVVDKLSFRNTIVLLGWDSNGMLM